MFLDLYALVMSWFFSWVNNSSCGAGLLGLCNLNYRYFKVIFSAIRMPAS